MDDPLRPISTLELLDRTLNLYCRNFVKFAGLSIVGPVATFAYRLGYGGGTVALVRLHSSTTPSAVLGVLVGIMIVLAGASISSAATVEAAAAVNDAHLGDNLLRLRMRSRSAWHSAQPATGSSASSFVTAYFLPPSDLDSA
jgi:hypothetical protein